MSLVWIIPVVWLAFIVVGGFVLMVSSRQKDPHIWEASAANSPKVHSFGDPKPGRSTSQTSV